MSGILTSWIKFNTGKTIKGKKASLRGTEGNVTGIKECVGEMQIL